MNFHNDTIRITNEDNMLLMARYPDKYFELAIIDPPYGIGADKEKVTPKNYKWESKKRKGYASKNWDSSTPDLGYFDELFRVSKRQIIWGGELFWFDWRVYFLGQVRNYANLFARRACLVFFH